LDGFKGEYDCDEWIDNRGFYIEIRRLRCLREEIFKRRDWSGGLNKWDKEGDYK